MMTMENLILALIAGMVIVMIMMLYRLFAGPTIYDRFNGLMVLGSDAIMLVILIGAYIGRIDMFVDISLTFAVLGFVSWIVFGKYIGEVQTQDKKGDVDV
jgi:multicomponent Na+:H+ antiporter subunit F